MVAPAEELAAWDRAVGAHVSTEQFFVVLELVIVGTWSELEHDQYRSSEPAATPTIAAGTELDSSTAAASDRSQIDVESASVGFGRLQIG